jgi:serine/threonine-protein kinase HipA
MTFNKTVRLDVHRTLSDGSMVQVGVMAQNRQGVFFQYLPDYLQKFGNLSPYKLKADGTLQLAPQTPHFGLHGVFADSLPDGWGMLLMDRVFRQHQLLPTQITAMDRLAFVGSRGMGALSFQPVSELSTHNQPEFFDLNTLGTEAQLFFDGHTEEVLAALVQAGSSGGARPKAQLYFANSDFKRSSTSRFPNAEAWLVKFTSERLALSHEEGMCEATYLQLAKNSGIDVPDWTLLEAGNGSQKRSWLALKRFDVVANKADVEGRLHLHSTCGLLDADFRLPSLDYEDLIKVSSALCKSPAAGQQQFKRAVFNLFALNHDDHSKNSAFLQDDTGQWQLAPFYDVTFSPSAYGEHATAFAGFGKNPPLKTMQKLAAQANFSDWQQAQQVIKEVINVIQQFAVVARENDVSTQTIKLIKLHLEQVRIANIALVN